MSIKNARIDVLKLLIKQNEYDSQESLLAALQNEGFKVAQPTLSRDLHELKVSKVYDRDGKYRYALPSEGNFNHVSKRKPSRRKIIQSFGFVSIKFSGNIAVLKTLHGYADSLSAEIDEYDTPGVLGTLAGDDTILLIMEEGADRQPVLDLLEEIMPGYSNLE